MPWCPKCRTEYRDGYTVCTDCGEKLVAELPQLEEKARPQPSQADTPVYLTTVSDEQEMEHITQLLHASKIPFFTQDMETGEYMRIFMGFSLYGQKVYVRAKDAPLCMQLLASMQGEFSEEETENAYEEYMQKAEQSEEPLEEADEELLDRETEEETQESGGYKVLLGFLLFFGLLILAAILKTVF